MILAFHILVSPPLMLINGVNFHSASKLSLAAEQSYQVFITYLPVYPKVSYTAAERSQGAAAIRPSLGDVIGEWMGKSAHLQGLAGV